MASCSKKVDLFDAPCSIWDKMRDSQKAHLLEWNAYFEDIGLPESLINIYLPYIETLSSQNLPIIFEFSHLAALLGRTTKYLASVVNAPENHYREFYIPKRSGGKRLITAPYPALLECQKWININILKNVKINKYAHGFIRHRSIITNASKHLNKQYVLKFDIKDFFPSISINRIIKIFCNLGYAFNISIYLAKLCCHNNVLSQGAATSPALSNIVASKLDHRLAKLSEKFKLDYSRYADDLTFSGKNLPNSFQYYVSQIVSSEGFTINPKKSRLYKNNQRKIVTGLNVAGKSPKVPRAYKRKVRQEVFHLLDKGYYSHAAKRKIHDPFYIDSLLGKLNFWSLVEPNNQFVKTNIPKLKQVKRLL